jgi:hypothetical protein
MPRGGKRREGGAEHFSRYSRGSTRHFVPPGCIVGGLMSRPASVLPLLLAVTLGSCKLARKQEQTGRELPPPEPAATNPPSKPTELPAPTPRPRDTAGAPTRPATTSTEPVAKPATPSEAGGTPQPAPAAPAATPAATVSATAAPPATAPAAAGAPPALDTSCLPRCQSALQACVSKPPALDGGLPSLESMAECRKAFDDCRKECRI